MTTILPLTGCVSRTTTNQFVWVTLGNLCFICIKHPISQLSLHVVRGYKKLMFYFIMETFYLQSVLAPCQSNFPSSVWGCSWSRLLVWCLFGEINPIVDESGVSPAFVISIVLMGLLSPHSGHVGAGPLTLSSASTLLEILEAIKHPT